MGQQGIAARGSPPSIGQGPSLPIRNFRRLLRQPATQIGRLVRGASKPLCSRRLHASAGRLPPVHLLVALRHLGDLAGAEVRTDPDEARFGGGSDRPGWAVSTESSTTRTGSTLIGAASHTATGWRSRRAMGWSGPAGVRSAPSSRDCVAVSAVVWA
jgi:hypothetical protein